MTSIAVAIVIALLIMAHLQTIEGFSESYWKKVQEQSNTDRRQYVGLVDQSCSVAKPCVSGTYCYNGHCRQQMLVPWGTPVQQRPQQTYQFHVLLSKDENILRVTAGTEDSDYAVQTPGLTVVCFDKNRKLHKKGHFSLQEEYVPQILSFFEQLEKDGVGDMIVCTVWGISDWRTTPHWKIRTLFMYYGSRLIKYIDNNWFFVTTLSDKLPLYEDVAKVISYSNNISVWPR